MVPNAKAVSAAGVEVCAAGVAAGAAASGAVLSEPDGLFSDMLLYLFRLTRAHSTGGVAVEIPSAEAGSALDAGIS